MSYGLEVYNSDGELMTDNKKLMNRVYYQVIVNSETSYYYPEPINYKPPIMQLILNDNDNPFYGYTAEHIKNENGQYVGFSTVADGQTPSSTIISVFKIK